MLKRIGFLAKNGNRLFGLSKEFPALSKQLDSFRETQEVFNSKDYRQISKLFSLENQNYKRRSAFKRETVTMMLGEKNFGTRLLKKYFTERKEFGFDDKMLMEVIKRLSQYKDIMDNSSFADDVLFYNLFSSEIFLVLLKDVRLLCTRNFVSNTNTIKMILDSLRQLGYKDQELIELVCNKIYFEQFGCELVDGTFDDLERTEKINIDGLMNERLAVIMESDRFRHFSDRLLKATDFAYVNPNQMERENSDDKLADEFANSLNDVRNTLFNYKNRFFKILDAVCQLRDYYMKLQENEKQVFIKKNPSLLIDFLEFEEQLIELGIIMPKDVLDKKGSKEVTDMVLKAFLLENDVDIDEMEKMASLFEVKEEKKKFDSYDELLVQNRKQKTEDLLKLLISLVDYSKTRVSCIDSKDDYKDGKFDEFIDILEKNSKTEGFNTKLKNMIDTNYRMIDEKQVKLAEHYYTKPFSYLRDFSFKFVNKLNTENLTTQSKFNIRILKEKLLIDSEQFNDIVEESKEDFLSLVDPVSFLSSAKEVSYKEFKHFLNTRLDNSLMDFIKTNIENESVKIGYRLFLLQILFFIKTDQSFKQHHSQADKLFKHFLSESNLRYFLNTHRKFQVPVSGNAVKMMMFLRYAEKEYKEYIEENGLVDLMRQTTVFLRTTLNMDWHLQDIRDPVYFHILNGLNNFYEAEQRLARACFDLDGILSKNCSPQFLFIDGDKLKVVNLLKSDKKEGSFDVVYKNKITEYICEKEFGVKVNTADIEIKRFFEDKDYFLNHDFRIKNISKYVKDKMGVGGNDVVSVFGEEVVSVVDGCSVGKEAESALLDVKGKLVSVVNNARNIRVINNKDYNNCLVQISFLLDLVKSIVKEEDKGRIETLNNKLNTLKQEKKEENKEISFRGKRLGLSGYKSNGFFARKELELLNYNLFRKDGYFVFEEWEEELKPYLSRLDFDNASDDYLYTNYSTLQNTLLPLVTGREIIKNNKINSYWDYSVVDNDNKENDLNSYMNSIVSKQKEQLSSQHKQKLATLNMLYEFRTVEDFNGFFAELVELPLWNYIFSKADKESLIDIDSIFTNNDLFNFENTTNNNIDNYKEKIEGLKDMKKKMGYYQKLITEDIPLEFANAKDEQTRDMLYNYSNKVKQDYIELMEEYNSDFVESYKTHGQTEYKDSKNELIFEEGEDELDTTLPTKPNHDIRLTRITDLIRFKILNSKNVVNSYTENYTRKIGTGEFLVNRNLPLLDYTVKISDVFGEEEYSFFDKYLPHGQIREIGDMAINDLLITISLMIDSRYVNLTEMTTFLNNHYTNNKTLTEEEKESILNLFDNRIDNSTKFAHDFARRKIQQNNNQLKDKDFEKFVKVFSLSRSGLNR